MPNHAEDEAKAWDLMESIRICMLTTQKGDMLRSRPMFAHIDIIAKKLYFLTDVTHHKDDEIEQAPSVCLAFADTENRKYVSVSGFASVSNDRQKIKYLWSSSAETWWDNADDPSIRILTITPTAAEYWDSPGAVVTTIKMLTATITGEKPDIGDNAKVNL